MNLEGTRTCSCTLLDSHYEATFINIPALSQAFQPLHLGEEYVYCSLRLLSALERVSHPTLPPEPHLKLFLWPQSGLHEVPVATRKESGVLCFPST